MPITEKVYPVRPPEKGLGDRVEEGSSGVNRKLRGRATDAGRKPIRVWRWVGLGLGLLAVVGLATLTGRVSTSPPFFWFFWAWTVHFLLMIWMMMLASAVPLPHEGGWYRVRDWEPRLYRRLGVMGFMRLLRAVGWERVNRSARKFDGTRASLPAFERDTRASEFSHAVLGALGFVLVLGAVLVRAWDAAFWLLAVNVFLHVYPVMLQRTMRKRIEGLLERGRSGSR